MVSTTTFPISLIWSHSLVGCAEHSFVIAMPAISEPWGASTGVLSS